jgi:hypothetical protein
VKLGSEYYLQPVKQNGDRVNVEGNDSGNDWRQVQLHHGSSDQGFMTVLNF